MSSSLKRRIENEKNIHNQGLDRKSYDNIFSHTNDGPGHLRLSIKIMGLMKSTTGMDVLEIGSQCWVGWIDFVNSPPKSLTCINISEAELQKGNDISLAMGVNEKINFKIMDAHNLQLKDSSIDIIYGGSILHHLEFELAIKEFTRVLKPNGSIMFVEPLGVNPVGKLVRFFTPNARTPDEKPISLKNIQQLKKHFKTQSLTYCQLAYVPAGIISKILFQSPFNILTKLADYLDIVFSKIILVRMLCRYVIIFCKK